MPRRAREARSLHPAPVPASLMAVVVLLVALAPSVGTGGAAAMALGASIPCGIAPAVTDGLDDCQDHIDCHEAPDLAALVDCVFDAMPGKASFGYEAPHEDERAALRAAGASLLRGECHDALLPVTLWGVYRAVWLDADDVCVLLETADANGDGIVDRGWGTFVVRAGPARDVQLQAVHPRFDLGTGHEAADVFAAVGAHSLAIAGTHRHANPVASTACHAGQSASDVAQCRDNGVTAWTLASLDASSTLTFVQLHGMADASCTSDVHITEGFAGPLLAAAPAERLADAFHEVRPDAVVSRGGATTACHLDGTKNVQGRLINGVPWEDVLTTPAPGPNGRFVHIEQGTAFRVADDWATAFEAAFPLAGGA